MKFCWCTLTVNKFEESISFYQDIIGLPIVRRLEPQAGVKIVFLGDGETNIELIYNETVKEVNIGQNISLGFEVESVSDKILFLERKGVEVESGPYRPNPHVKFINIMDPNGLKIQLIEKFTGSAGEDMREAF
ncbi:lactoylglutathione lyase [Ruminiclostridium sufflavum DSM 19573]|uniref:Lactoylglutathione lyase n=1 Tax=Ruminiclostridium sufflavum DSM 19573 TaxID=1121337 RepID=A0A318Y3M4_9FIRM|nr:VOC family protein [Ruminiclostridium sufflavum]PYG90178.1 lactoylglutathione lyase [Ruminiclostridium sufflavum DSM 19573]